MGQRPCPTCGGSRTITVSEMRPSFVRTGPTHVNVPVQRSCPRCSGSGSIYVADPRPPRPPRAPRPPRDPKPKKQPPAKALTKARNTKEPARGRDAREEAPEPSRTGDRDQTAWTPPPRPERRAWTVEQFFGLGIAGLATWGAHRGGAAWDWYWWPALFLGVAVAAIMVLNRFQVLTKILCALVLLALAAAILRA
jgi:hypothetical protein